VTASRKPHPRARARSVDHAEWPAFLEDLAQGLPFDVAARLHGMVPETIEDALKHDDEAKEAVSRAKARGEAMLLENHLALAKLGERTTGLEWRLERLYPKHWHQASKSEVSVTATDEATAEKLAAAIGAAKKL
jgi:hypothetical protein